MTSGGSNGGGADHPLARAFVRFTLRHGRWLWAVALVLAIPAMVGTVGLYARLSSAVEELLPRDADSVKAIEELRARMPGLQYLGVVVDAGDVSRLPAAERFLDDLAARIRMYPTDLVRAVKTGADEERRFFQKNAALYADLPDIVTVRERLGERRRWEMSKSIGALLDDEPAPSVDFKDIATKYQKKTKAVRKLGRGRFTGPEIASTLLLVEVGAYSTGAEHAGALLDNVRADVAALGGLDRYAPGMTMGFAADVAVSAEEISALAADLTVASSLVVAAVALVILLYFRWWRSVPALVLPLVLATTYAFGLATLPPWNVDRLNSNTAFLGSIIVGNGINFAILFLARYVEARRRGAAVEDALSEAVWGSRLGTLVAALAAAVAYGSLLVTQFRGFRQFGAIGGIGMVLCWVVTFVLLPPLVAWLDRGPATAPRPRPPSSEIMAPIARFVARRPVPLVVLGAVLTAGALGVVPRLDSSVLESDFSRLRRRDTWTAGEGYWGRKMDRVLERYLSPTVLLTDSPEEARALAARLREAARQPPLDELVSEVRGPDDVLPANQEAKIDEVKALKRLLTPATRAAIDPEQLKELDELLGTVPERPIGPADLPGSLAVGMREMDGSFGKSVLVFPTLSRANWQNDHLATFTRELRRAAAAAGNRPARVAGAFPLSADIVDCIGRDGPLASALAFAGVLTLVLVMFRSGRNTFFVIGSLLGAVLWLAAATFLLKVKINFVNFIAFPITFGIGVDYAVNVMSRYLQEGESGVEGPIRSTGAAVALCSMTTIIGYSSLLLAKNQGLFLFGLLAVMGEIACLSTAILMLPAVLVLRQRRRRRTGESAVMEPVRVAAARGERPSMPNPGGDSEDRPRA